MRRIDKYLAFGAVILLLPFQLTAGDYSLDKTNSKVKWTGRKVVGEHYGNIDLKSGHLKADAGIITAGTFVMEMNSIVNDDLSNETVNRKLVGHLKSDDFFSVDKFPVSTFVISEVKPKGGKIQTVTGDLTIKGITNPVTFDAEVDITEGKLSASGKMEVDRTLYDVRYGSGRFFAGLGDNLIYDTFTLEFTVVAIETTETVLLEPIR